MSNQENLNPGAKDYTTNWLLALLLGVFGVDRFYLGKVGTGILKLVTFGGLGVWWLVDVILAVVGGVKDKRGNSLAGIPAKKTIPWAVTAVIVLLLFISSTANSASSSRDSVSSPATSSSSGAKSSTATTSSTPTPKVPVVPTQTFTGKGDDVVAAKVVDPAVVTFTCTSCTRNVVVKTDGSDSLLVNKIGAYSGQRIVNVTDGSMITSFEIKANAPWTLTIADLTSIPLTSGVASGSGDVAVHFTKKATSAAVEYVGKSNFVVYGYGGSSRQLAVNEIGSYQGTVKLTLPGYVQVLSEGNWTISPK